MKNIPSNYEMKGEAAPLKIICSISSEQLRKFAGGGGRGAGWWGQDLPAPITPLAGGHPFHSPTC